MRPFFKCMIFTVYFLYETDGKHQCKIEVVFIYSFINSLIQHDPLTLAYLSSLDDLVYRRRYLVSVEVEGHVSQHVTARKQHRSRVGDVLTYCCRVRVTRSLKCYLYIFMEL